MAAVAVTGKVAPIQVQRLAMQGKPHAGLGEAIDYSIEGDSAPDTWTVTFEYTKSTGALTVDYAKT